MSTIYMLGDSHTQALGPRLKTLYGDGFRFEAFPGYSTARADAARKLSPSGAETILLSLGGNDFGDQSAARHRLIDNLRAKNQIANIVWVGPFHSNDPSVDKRHQEQTHSQRVQFSSAGVRWIDGRPLSAPLTHIADGTHFTPSSYSVLAEKIAEVAGTTTKTGLGIGFVAALIGVGWWLLRKMQRAT